jgi:hypothetical protein
MPNYSSKKDTTRATPAKKGDIKLQHNLLDIVGETLLAGIQQGRLNPKAIKNFQADLGFDLGSGYGANVGYNQYIGDLRQDLKLTLSKKF